MKRFFAFTAFLAMTAVPFAGIALSARSVMEAGDQNSSLNPLNGAVHLISFLAPAEVPVPLNGMGFPE